MSMMIYRLKCLTNLHMGSGDINYSVIDLEVERDPVLNEPTMNASGVKGALRDHCKNKGADLNDVTYIFGSEGRGDQQGMYQFFSGDLIARPVRVSADGSTAFALATTSDLIERFLTKLEAFCPGTRRHEEWDAFIGSDAVQKTMQEGKLVSGMDLREIEGYPAEKIGCRLLSEIIGTDKWVLMTSAQLSEIDLPVMAHNVLDNGISKNLWYEQVVPHQSVFMLMIQAPDGNDKLEQLLKDNAVVQFGAGATTGNGYTLLEKWGE